MFAPEHIALYEELRKEAEAKTAAVDPQLLRHLLIGAGGAALGAVPAALITRHFAEKERQRTRNRAFGAGVATGVAAPRILRTVFNLADRAGLVAPDPGYGGIG